MAAPFLVGVVVLVVGPMLLTGVMAFFRWDLTTSPEFVGFGNFAELGDDEIFRIALRNSLTFVAVAVPLRLVVAVGLALALQRRGRVTGGAILAPSLVPEAALALAWLWIFNPLYGPLNLLLEAVGLPTPSWLTEPGPARWAVIVMSLFTVGEAFLLATAARRAIPRELYDLATEQGARAWGRLFRVTIPMLAPVLLLIVARDVVLSFQVTFIPALLVTEGGPPPYSTTYLPLYVYRTAFEYLRYGTASAAILLVLLLTASVLWLQLRIVLRWRGRLVDPVMAANG
jgi:multiple sugar transport system permease protein